MNEQLPHGHTAVLLRDKKEGLPSTCPTRENCRCFAPGESSSKVPSHFHDVPEKTDHGAEITGQLGLRSRGGFRGAPRELL